MVTNTRFVPWKKAAPKKRSHQAEREEQIGSESGGKTGGPPISEPRRQHACGEEAA